MRTILIIALTCCIGCLAAVAPPPSSVRPQHLLGLKECTWGPSYWCKNLTTSAACHATKHCIQTVWIHQQLPPDGSSVCDTCKEMVKEARDQLLSNETQEEIKEVFEGSCKLLPIKEIAKECCKLADEFIPELVDTLASQMDPQVVCSVAGLCNSERVQQLLAESQNGVVRAKKSPRCDDCHTVVSVVEDKFRKASRDQVLQGFLQVCGRMGSLSDACSNIIVTYFTDIYKHLEENLNPEDFCLMAGECSAMFHTHMVDVEVTPLSKVGVVPVSAHDDLPCDLCEQLVKHLRDILIANTTEDEFHMVLQGICKQTKSFKDECLGIVDEYYPMIYNFLVSELNGTVVCSMIGICPRRGGDYEQIGPIAPLLPVPTAQSPLLEGQQVVPINRVGINSQGINVKVLPPQDTSPEFMQLPIERIMPQTLTIVGNTELCTFCQYFLHYVQQALTEPATEEEIKRIVEGACRELPSSVNETCEQFVDTYGPAFIAILAQKIDPSVICPKLSLCPSEEARNVEVFMHRNKGEKPDCPLCLFAITSLEEMIKRKRTEDNIRHALSQLCSYFKGNLKEECDDFVETYTDEIVEACLAQLTPQEVCVYLKLCEDKSPAPKTVPQLSYGGEIETNEIPDVTVNGKYVPQQMKNSPVCVLCEFVMSQLEQELENNATEDEIKNAVHQVCNHLPKSVSKECNDFVTQYADMVIQLLIENLNPNQVCAELKLCDKNHELTEADVMAAEFPSSHENEELEVHVSSPQCSLCKIIMTQIEKLLDGKINEDDIIKAVHRVCSYLPRTQKDECNNFIDKNGKTIIDLLKMAIQPSEICSILFFCESELTTIKNDVRNCTVCEASVDVMDKLLQNPRLDHSLDHVLEKTCRAQPPQYQKTCLNIINSYGPQMFQMLSQSTNPQSVCSKIGLCVSRVPRALLLDHPLRKRRQALGADHCSWGPGYWCSSEAHAKECGMDYYTYCPSYLHHSIPRPNQIMPGSQVCSIGPGYWCSSEANAKECGIDYYVDCPRLLGHPVRKRSQALGKDRCSWGPGYWCSSEAHAKECGMDYYTYCPNYLHHPISKPGGSTRLPDTCGMGPDYWCSSQAHAKECGLDYYKDCPHYLHHSIPRPNQIMPGSQVCSIGPGYWCSSEAHAKECGIDYYVDCPRLLGHPVRKRRQVGKDECTWGPSYWCETEENARKCNAIEHCQEKVWNQGTP